MTNLKTGIGIGRRQILKLAGFGALGLMSDKLWPFTTRTYAGQNTATAQAKEFMPDLDVSLVARPTEISILPGNPTQVWQYQPIVHRGDPNKVSAVPGSYLGPTFNVRRGEKVRIRFTNSTPEKSIVHWHGLHVPAIMDGHPRDVISPGETYLYEFKVVNRAGTYWYHPHPHGRTGPQVYRGLAGLFVVSDDEEQSAGLPSGKYDVPLVIQDRIFDRNNQLVYTSGHPMEQMTGFLGDWVLVNGLPDFMLPVATNIYRLRILNGSNSRIYRLAWQDGRALTVIGTDGGLLERPVQKEYAFLSPGERLEVWADFSNDPVGFQTALVSLPFDAGSSGRRMRMGRGMMRGQGLPNGAGLTIAEFKVADQERKKRELPQKLAQINPVRVDEAVNVSNPKQFFLTMSHMQWSINGRTFQMEDVAEDEVVQLGTREIWEFNNRGGRMMHMMNMPHPIHLHGKQFRIIERRGANHRGYVDYGWKDTVLIMPGERAKILVGFDDYPGMLLYHCHNLEHEDMGMMRNYYIRG